MRIADRTPWWGIHVGLWAGTRPTPLWLCFSGGAPESLKGRDDPQVFNGRDVPIYLPVGEEYDAVLDAVVERLAEVADRISPEAQPPVSE